VDLFLSLSLRFSILSFSHSLSSFLKNQPAEKSKSNQPTQNQPAEIKQIQPKKSTCRKIKIKSTNPKSTCRNKTNPTQKINLQKIKIKPTNPKSTFRKIKQNQPKKSTCRKIKIKPTNPKSTCRNKSKPTQKINLQKNQTNQPKINLQK
jgi:hypothetical protein